MAHPADHDQEQPVGQQETEWCPQLRPHRRARPLVGFGGLGGQQRRAVRTSLAILAAFLDRLGRHESAATIVGFALSPVTTAAIRPEITTAIAHLRDVLGDQTYELLARSGETMTMTAVATYAYDQIDQARAELKAVSR